MDVLTAVVNVETAECWLHIIRDKRCVVLQEILDANVEYVKIFTEGHAVPSASVQQT